MCAILRGGNKLRGIVAAVVGVMGLIHQWDIAQATPSIKTFFMNPRLKVPNIESLGPLFCDLSRTETREKERKKIHLGVI
jgi:hypothetical protein